MSDKRPLIFFSGGLDSTYLLYDRLTKGINVDIVYADGGQSEIKAHAEKLAREAIIEEIQKRTYGKVINRYELGPVEPTHDPFHRSGKGLMKAHSSLWSQPGAWFLTAVFAVNVEEHSAVEVGVVLGDQVGRSVDQLRWAWDHFLAAVAIHASHRPKLEYPISHLSKEMILKKLPPEIRALVWFCEVPDWREGKAHACGLCRPCRTMANELALLEQGDHYHDYPASYARFMRDRNPREEKLLTLSQDVVLVDAVDDTPVLDEVPADERKPPAEAVADAPQAERGRRKRTQPAAQKKAAARATPKKASKSAKVTSPKRKR